LAHLLQSSADTGGAAHAQKSIARLKRRTLIIAVRAKWLIDLVPLLSNH
jgi:hypothetical protein